MCRRGRQEAHVPGSGVRVPPGQLCQTSVLGWELRSSVNAMEPTKPAGEPEEHASGTGAGAVRLHPVGWRTMVSAASHPSQRMMTNGIQCLGAADHNFNNHDLERLHRLGQERSASINRLIVDLA